MAVFKPEPWLPYKASLHSPTARWPWPIPLQHATGLNLPLNSMGDYKGLSGRYSGAILETCQMEDFI